MDSVAAKQFLISKVIEEAEFEQVSLSDIEKKMLHFTEVHPTIPNILEINEEFEKNYDSDEYEEKVTRLLKNARDRDSQSNSTLDQQWKDTFQALRDEDHYILIMAGEAFGSDVVGPVEKQRVRNYFIYMAIGIFIVLAIFFWYASH